jgi:glucokinase
VAEAAGLPARIENDATMALVAEAAGRPEGGHGLIAMLTVGTGSAGRSWSVGGSCGAGLWRGSSGMWWSIRRGAPASAGGGAASRR